MSLLSATDALKPKDPAAAETTEEAVAEEEPEEQTKTLDEYLATKKAAAAPLPEARKPNEGADDSKWKDAVALEKPEEEDFFGGKVCAPNVYLASFSRGKKKKKKHHVSGWPENFSKPHSPTANFQSPFPFISFLQGQSLKQKNKTKKEKVHVEIEQRFVEENAKRGGFRGGERGERGGRGASRGGQRGGQQRGGRGGRRGGRQSAAVNLDDATAFPTLGA